MATYIAKNANGEQVNLVEIEAAQVENWQKLTGLTLELPTEIESEVPDAETMETALNELGVVTRE